MKNQTKALQKRFLVILILILIILTIPSVRSTNNTLQKSEELNKQAIKENLSPIDTSSSDKNIAKNNPSETQNNNPVITSNPLQEPINNSDSTKNINQEKEKKELIDNNKTTKKNNLETTENNNESITNTSLQQSSTNTSNSSKHIIPEKTKKEYTNTTNQNNQQETGNNNPVITSNPLQEPINNSDSVKNVNQEKEKKELIDNNKTTKKNNLETAKENLSNYENNSKYEYIPLNKIKEILKNKTSNSTIPKKEIKNIPKKRKTIFYEENKNSGKNQKSVKAIEALIYDNITIEKIEHKKSKTQKEIIIQSNQHVEDEVTAYTNIPEISPDQKSKINIYWKNQNKKIAISNFYDTNDNGLYDRISWKIPHLSEQIFEININLSIENPENNTSENLSLEVIEQPSNITPAENPINFKFKINYENYSNLDCRLDILGTKNIEFKLNISNPSLNLTDLPNGNYHWMLYCDDKENPSIRSDLQDNFKINQTFKISGLEDSYLNTESINFQVFSKNNTLTKVQLIAPDSGRKDYPNLTGSYPQTITLDSQDTQIPGIYKINITSDSLAKPRSILKEFSIIKMTLSKNKNNTLTNEDLEISFSINSPSEKISSFILDFRDNNLSYEDNLNQNSITRTYHHAYKTPGEYVLKLTANIGGKTFSIERNGIHVNESENPDTEAPEIILIGPEDNALINENQITFSYKSIDNIKLDNCTFELYNNSGSFGVLEYNKTEDEIENNQTIEVKLEHFNEGDYTWYVKCFDNSSNQNEKSRDFKISFENSTKEESNDSKNDENSSKEFKLKSQEIQDLLKNVNDFLEKEDSFNADEKQVLEDLEITKDVGYYKKRLIQIDQDLGTNIQFIKDKDLKEKRKNEILKELEDIKSKIPHGIEILNKHEFVKNSLPKNLLTTITEYLNSKNAKLSTKKIKILTELNKNIQDYISVSTNVRQIKVEYLNNTKKITLVTKQIKLKNETSDILLETIPKEIVKSAKQVHFLAKSKIIKDDPIIEVSFDDLDEDKLVYYIEDLVNVTKFEDTETILFKEFPTSNAIGITGFSIFEFTYFSGPFSYILLIIFIIFLIYLGSICYQKIRLVIWKKEENVRRTFKLIKRIKHELKEEDLENARENYHKLREMYPLLPKSCKKYLYKELRKIQIGIDRRDIFNLVKEWEKAKKQGRKQDALELYKNISSVYKRLPKKYQEKIYKKMFRPSFDT